MPGRQKRLWWAGEGKLNLFVAIDPTSKFAFARLVESAGKMEAAQFLRDLVEVVPYRIHTVLTDNGVQFTSRKQDIWDSRHIFDLVCAEHGIEHRLTKVNHRQLCRLRTIAIAGKPVANGVRSLFTSNALCASQAIDSGGLAIQATGTAKRKLEEYRQCLGYGCTNMAGTRIMQTQ